MEEQASAYGGSGLDAKVVTTKGEKKLTNLQVVGLTLLGVALSTLIVYGISWASIDVYQRSEVKKEEIFIQAKVKAEGIAAIGTNKSPTPSDYTIRVETGATIMTKVWYAKDMNTPIIRHMLVTPGVCTTSQKANEEALAQVKKPASFIVITCKKITELNQ